MGNKGLSEEEIYQSLLEQAREMRNIKPLLKKDLTGSVAEWLDQILLQIASFVKEKGGEAVSLFQGGDQRIFFSALLETKDMSRYLYLLDTDLDIFVVRLFKGGEEFLSYIQIGLLTFKGNGPELEWKYFLVKDTEEPLVYREVILTWKPGKKEDATFESSWEEEELPFDLDEEGDEEEDEEEELPFDLEEEGERSDDLYENEIDISYDDERNAMIVKSYIDGFVCEAEEELSAREKRMGELLWKAEKERIRLGLNKDCFMLLFTTGMSCELSPEDWSVDLSPLMCADAGEDSLYIWYLEREKEDEEWKDLKLALYHEGQGKRRRYQDGEWREVSEKGFIDSSMILHRPLPFVELYTDLKGFFATAQENLERKNDSLMEIYEDAVRLLEEDGGSVVTRLKIFPNNMRSFLISIMITCSLREELPIFDLTLMDGTGAYVYLIMDEENLRENDWYFFAGVVRHTQEGMPLGEKVMLPAVYLGE